MNIGAYQNDLASFGRVVEHAIPENKLAAFAMICREGIRWHTIGDVEKPDIIDALREIGIRAALPEEDIQDALAKAVDNPFDPNAWKLNGGSNAKHVSLLPLRTVAVDSLHGVPVPSRKWHVAGLIPAGTVTILGGDGDAGKTLLGLQLAAATAARQKWIGQETASGRALYFSAEDDMDELHRRLADIAAAMGITLAELADLSLVPLVDEDDGDTVFAVPEPRSNLLKPTALWRRAEGLVADLRPALIGLDPLADLFGGDENSRPQARQFVGLLRSLCRRHGTTIVLLAHPSLTGMATGSGTSGSTAWSNSVRSRLYLKRITARDEGAKTDIEDDADRRVLTNKKANYAKRGTEIALRWRAGVFEVDDGQASELSSAPRIALHDEAFLSMLDRYRRQGREVSATPSANYAPSIFADDPAAGRIGKSALTGAMNRLLSDGRITIDEFGPPSKRRKRLVVGVAA